MTREQTTLLNTNVRLSIATICTIIAGVATFVWQGNQFVNRIISKMDAQGKDIIQVQSAVIEQEKDTKNLSQWYVRHDVRIHSLEQKVFAK